MLALPYEPELLKDAPSAAAEPRGGRSNGQCQRAREPVVLRLRSDRLVQ